MANAPDRSVKDLGFPTMCHWSGLRENIFQYRLCKQKKLGIAR